MEWLSRKLVLPSAHIGRAGIDAEGPKPLGSTNFDPVIVPQADPNNRKTMALYHLHTQIEINASAEHTWAVLSDFASYPEWNPFIRSVAGVPQQGARLQIVIQPNGGKRMTFSPMVLAADEGRELRWRGRLLLPGVFDGEHRFAIEPLGENRVRFEQSERFSGLLVGALRASLERDTRRGFEDMNQALKARAEDRARTRIREASAPT